MAGLAQLPQERIDTHRCLVSPASIWEVAINHRLGKLPLAPEVLIQLARDAGFELLFDRLLLAQARLEHFSLITADAHLLRYGDAVESL